MPGGFDEVLDGFVRFAEGVDIDTITAADFNDLRTAILSIEDVIGEHPEVALFQETIASSVDARLAAWEVFEGDVSREATSAADPKTEMVVEAAIGGSGKASLHPGHQVVFATPFTNKPWVFVAPRAEATTLAAYGSTALFDPMDVNTHGFVIRPRHGQSKNVTATGPAANGYVEGWHYGASSQDISTGALDGAGYSSTTTSITDASQSWTGSEWSSVGAQVHMWDWSKTFWIWSLDWYAVRTVTANTTDTLTWVGATPTPLEVGQIGGWGHGDDWGEYMVTKGSGAPIWRSGDKILWLAFDGRGWIENVELEASEREETALKEFSSEIPKEPHGF